MRVLVRVVVRVVRSDEYDGEGGEEWSVVVRSEEGAVVVRW